MKEGYLERKLEPKREVEPVVDALGRPWIEVDYEKQTSAEVILGKGKKKLRFSAKWKSNESPFEGWSEELKKEYEALLGKEGWKMITGFGVESVGDEDVDVESLYALEGFGAVLFKPYTDKDPDDPIRHGQRSFLSSNEELEGGVAYLSGDIFTPGVLLALFHEAGHANAIAKKTVEGRERFLWAHRQFHELINHPVTIHPKHAREITETVLKEERTAWATGLKIAKPFMKVGAFSKEDVFAMVHQWALQNYSNQSRDIMGGPVKKLLGIIKESLSQLFQEKE